MENSVNDIIHRVGKVEENITTYDGRLKHLTSQLSDTNISSREIDDIFKSYHIHDCDNIKLGLMDLL